ncbi:hypothetical protein [Kitasatospora azatica]|uniref:hypothetical protein n=1 Tax=Kitasatospora azatica TaxID=58347 RepID=UPI0006910962|nr:hypothetical protein [Kitasatospora azatica]
MSLRSSTVAGVTVTALGMGALGFTLAPAVDDLFGHRHVVDAGYASGAQAKAARASVPGWLPDGATEIKYRMATAGGERLLRAHLPGGGLPAGCTGAAAQPAAARPHPAKLTAAWFPAEAGHRLTATCGHYQVVIDGDQLYAWQSR